MVGGCSFGLGLRRGLFSAERTLLKALDFFRTQPKSSFTRFYRSSTHPQPVEPHHHARASGTARIASAYSAIDQVDNKGYIEHMVYNRTVTVGIPARVVVERLTRTGARARSMLLASSRPLT